MNSYPGWTWLNTCWQVWRDGRGGGGGAEEEEEEEPETDWQPHKLRLQVDNLLKSLSKNEMKYLEKDQSGRGEESGWNL